EEALRLYTGTPEAPARPREITVGATADLCLLDRPWAQARQDLSRVGVRATVVEGRLAGAAQTTGV
ncbi:MAG: metal-dependent hydrolase, partial [Acidimicrobiia bacterium]|nr:metal-dependent hydrolase [Acidimicrobiia bacterium]